MSKSMDAFRNTQLHNKFNKVHVLPQNFVIAALFSLLIADSVLDLNKTASSIWKTVKTECKNIKCICQ